MPDPSTLAVFVATSLLLLVTPGPAVLYIVARSVSQGRLAGIVSSLGLSLGGALHVAAAVLGLSAMVASSPRLFLGIKWAGAAYLVYLGLRTLLRSEEAKEIGLRSRTRLRKIFWDGVVINILNPKAALFFMAFLPQFVVPEEGRVWWQILVLGGIFLLLAMITDFAYALVAGTVGSLTQKNPGLLRAQRIVSGLVYIGLGIAAAFT